jgi:DNA-binding PadR family transcriptional regulator
MSSSATSTTTNNGSSNSVVPRGFSRFYVLSLLKEKPMTGKEIMEETTRRTQGAWKPSPGLVYPLLGKLLSAGLIEEVEEGRGYQITEKGEDLLSEYRLGRSEFDRLFGTFARFGLYGQLMARDASDKMIAMIKSFRGDISKLGKVQRMKYRKFLESELQRLDRSEQRERYQENQPRN